MCHDDDYDIDAHDRYVLTHDLLIGNICDLLTITAPCSSAAELSKRVGIVLTARVHPGETCASWIMQV